MTAERAPTGPAGQGLALQDRVLLITGAHGGLGSALASVCAAAGARVILLGRKVARLGRVNDAIARAGGDVSLYPLDLAGASPADYADMAERIEQTYGQLHGIAHCAAEFGGLTPLQNTDPIAFAQTLHVDLTAPVWLTQACLPLLQRTEQACVLFAIHRSAGSGRAYWGGYGLAQAALATLVGMLQAEQGSGGVRVTGLMPPPLRTPLRARAYTENEDRDAVDPARIAPMAAWLLSPAAAAERGMCRTVDVDGALVSPCVR